MHLNRQNLDHEVSMKFRRADRAFKRSIERRVRSTGVYRSQHRLLMHLNQNPNCSQVGLAEQLEISPAAIAVSLKKLEKGGYIRRETDENDNRIHQVLITEKGQEVIKQSIVLFQEIEEEMFSGFNEGEMEKLEEFLERIYRNLGAPGLGK